MKSQPRSAIVTGASGGIGLAVTSALREEGFAVTMVARNPEKLSIEAESIRAQPGPELHTVAGSVADENFLDAIAEGHRRACLLYTSPSPRDVEESRMPSSA